MTHDAPDADLTRQSSPEKRKRERVWSTITGITLHQLGVHRFAESAWPRVTAHLGVHEDGRVFLIHPLTAYLWSSNALNRDTIAIAVAGNFRFSEREPSSYWRGGGGPSRLSPAAEHGLRRSIRYALAQARGRGGAIRYIYAHRQARDCKSLCPGELVWRAGGVWAQEALGLSDGGFGYTRADGRPIPPEWDPRFEQRRARAQESAGAPLGALGYDLVNFEAEAEAEQPERAEDLEETADDGPATRRLMRRASRLDE
ncbi:MAG: N-acetylmuramoyl-L-alanine amidase [Myxococcales bacterium]|nr:N-acetylmuramoyl-L-alanine amidase [Myxococcales bacterium]